MSIAPHSLEQEEEHRAEVIDLALMRIRRRFGLPLRGLPAPAPGRAPTLADVVPLHPRRTTPGTPGTGPEVA